MTPPTVSEARCASTYTAANGLRHSCSQDSGHDGQHRCQLCDMQWWFTETHHHA